MTCREVRSPDFDLRPKSGMYSPSACGLQSFKVSTLLRFAQSASLRHLTEKPSRGLLSPGDAWIVAAQVPVPSTAATGRRTPPVAVVPGIVEGAIVVAAAAARKGRKPKVVRAVAATIPSIGRFQSRSLSSAEALCGDEIFQIRPLPIGRDMPSARTQAPRIVHGIPVVKPAILRQ